jgi:hypothetical protein
VRLSQGIDRVKSALDSVSGQKYTDARIGETLNSQLRSLVRKAVEVDQGYTNHRFVLASTVARNPYSGVYSYRLPPWIIKLVSVRRYLGSGAAKGPEIHRATKRQVGGWRYTAANEITLEGVSSAIDLDIECAKMPAALTKGTLPSQAGVTTSQLKLDADSSADAVIYPHETTLNAYAGALFEITGPSPAAGTRIGQILRCTGNTVDPTARLLTMEEAWTSQPQTSDTYEMVAELPDEHSELLVLLTARRLLAIEGNAKGISLYSQEIGEQWASYLSHVKSRDTQEPYFIAQSPFDVIQNNYMEQLT